MSNADDVDVLPSHDEQHAALMSPGTVSDLEKRLFEGVRLKCGPERSVGRFECKQLVDQSTVPGRSVLRCSPQEPSVLLFEFCKCPRCDVEPVAHARRDRSARAGIRCLRSICANALRAGTLSPRSTSAIAAWIERTKSSCSRRRIIFSNALTLASSFLILAALMCKSYRVIASRPQLSIHPQSSPAPRARSPVASSRRVRVWGTARCGWR